jgi:DNA-binding NarL/FixJ family response regulator
VGLDPKSCGPQSSAAVGSALSHRELAAGHDAIAEALWEDRPVPLRVLLVDDHAAFRAAATALLERDGIAVLAAVADGETAIAEAARLRPDVVLVDVQLPDLDGFDVAAAVAREGGAPVVLMSSRDRSTYADRIASSTARGFIAKQSLSGPALRLLLA